LVSHYRYVIVDCSGRMDQTTRLLSDLSNAVLMVAQTDVVSLWSAGRIRTFLEEGNARNRLRLVMNRYKKIPGFSEDEIEKVTNCKILWKIPNNYQLIAPAIDKGAPVAIHDNQEVSRAFRSLADMLALAPSAAEEGLDLVFQPEKDAKKKAPNRLLISPIRAGQ
jgi:septum formation inhibitor-activating ATPase MinD